jgi:hypothetical protein
MRKLGRKFAAAPLAALATMVGLVQLARAEPSHVVCVFRDGRANTYDKARFRSAKASPITIEIVDIKPEQQTAMLKGARGESALRIVRAVNALHFLEVVGEGYLTVTTVYDKDPARKVALGALPSVHSRHSAVLGQPIVSHYTGYCREK